MDFEILGFTPDNSQVQSLVKEVCSQLESKYQYDFTDRFIVLKEEKTLIKVYIIWADNKPIGYIGLTEELGETYGIKKNIHKLIMFRIIPKYRNRGIGNNAFYKICTAIFVEFPFQVIYAETTEYGAVKFYNRMDYVEFLHCQTDEVDLQKLLSLNLSNPFILNVNIKFKITRDGLK